MALEQKNAWPYSRDEREKRQDEVFRLHFEFGYSAVKIADLMKINRNTINADVKYWYSSISDEVRQDSKDLILRQIGRLEAQRTRIIENITEKKIDDVRYEKLLLDIDAKTNNMLLRINSSKETEIQEASEVQETLIKDMVLFLIIKHNRYYELKRENILSEIINMRQCTIIQANTIFSKMESIGLECCKKFKSPIFFYDLLEFAYLRRYVLPSDKFIDDVNLLHNLEIDNNNEKVKLSIRYSEKYGMEETWADEIFLKYDEDEKKIIQKYVETSSKVMIKVLENLPNQERVKKYSKYINVIFGKDRNEMVEFLEYNSYYNNK